jgi:hypothetical protein
MDEELFLPLLNVADILSYLIKLLLQEEDGVVRISFSHI